MTERDLGWPSYPHEVLAVVLSVRAGRLCVLLWQRQPAAAPRPVGAARRRRRGPTSGCATRSPATWPTKVDVREVAHLEQLATHSAVAARPARPGAGDRLPRAGARPTSSPTLPADTAWQPVDELPPTAFDHHFFIDAAVDRLRAKLSYTNIGFALAPPQFTIAELRDIVSAALGYQVSSTNLTRVLTRRRDDRADRRPRAPGPNGGRPAGDRLPVRRHAN